MFSDWHWILFFLIVLVIFGPKNLPKLAQAIGKSVRELKNGMAGLTDDIKDAANTPPAEQRRVEPKLGEEAPKPSTTPVGTVPSAESQTPKNG
jgi:sec-independent protein translocase protein TatA